MGAYQNVQDVTALKWQAAELSLASSSQVLVAATAHYAHTCAETSHGDCV